MMGWIMWLMKDGDRIQASSGNCRARYTFIQSHLQQPYKMGSRLSGETEAYTKDAFFRILFYLHSTYIFFL